MPNPPTPKASKVFVAPGVGRKAPLPLPGTGMMIPAEGRAVAPSIAVTRLLRSGDLVIVEPQAPAPSAPAASTASAVPVAKPAPKEG